MRTVDPILQKRLATLVSAMGYELVGCQLAPVGGQVVLRIYIDKEKGVTLDDCSLVSHQVSAMMDVEDPIAGRYTLEVSSPGIDRPLFEISQYKRYIGKRVNVRLNRAVEKRRQYKGKLLRVDEENIFLLIDIDGKDQEIRLPFKYIERGNLIGDIKFQKVGNGKRKRRLND